MVITYVSDVPQHDDEIAQAAQIWNDATPLVHFQPWQQGDSEPAMLRFVTRPYGQSSNADLGQGRGEVGLDAHDFETSYGVRVVAHELGHILGLPDAPAGGPCAQIMTGGANTEGADCTNAVPDPSEVAGVEQYWRDRG